MWTTSLAGFILQNWGASDDKIGKGIGHRHHAGVSDYFRAKDWRLKANSWRPATG
jgi:hypothetical protein